MLIYLDVFLSYMGIILSILLYLFFISNNASYIYYIPPSLLLLSSLMWGFLRKKIRDINMPFSWLRTRHYYTSYIIIYFISFFVVFYNRSFLFRPIIYFYIIAFLSSLILIDIITLSNKQSVLRIFIQIIFLSFNITWSQLFLVTDKIGVDPWYHETIIIKLIETGGFSKSGSYAGLFTYHLNNVIFSLLTNYNLKITTIFCTNVIQILIGSIYVFLICNKIKQKDVKFALVATLFFNMSSYIISSNVWFVPYTYAIIFILMLVYHFSLNNHNMSVFILVSFSLITTHALTSILMIIIYLCNTLIHLAYNKLVKEDIKINKNLPFIYSSLLFIWWTYVSEHIITLGYLIRRAFDFNIWNKTPPSLLGTLVVPFTEQVINRSSFFLFYFFSILGTYLVYKQKQHKFHIIQTNGLIMLLIGFISMILPFSLMESRWWFYSQIFLIFSISHLFMSILNSFHNKPIIVIIIIMIFGIYIFSSVISTSANFDNNKLFPTSSITYSFTNPELISIKTINNYYEQTILSDELFVGAMKYVGYNIHPFDVYYYNNTLFDLYSPILLRERIINQPFKIFSVIILNTMNMNKIQNEYNLNLVYMNKDVKLIKLI